MTAILDVAGWVLMGIGTMMNIAAVVIALRERARSKQGG
ncbi:hypothetical protein RSK60_1520033 [Ralstonia solanacearum K60]|nr:hypothetical protein RSK60_1520033 [Ralstonia solanacearum K60]